MEFKSKNLLNKTNKKSCIYLKISPDGEVEEEVETQFLTVKEIRSYFLDDAQVENSKFIVVAGRLAGFVYVYPKENFI